MSGPACPHLSRLDRLDGVRCEICDLEVVVTNREPFDEVTRGTPSDPLTPQGDGERTPGPRHRADKPLSAVLVQSLIVILLGGAAIVLAAMIFVTVGRMLGM